ncbi:MAG: 16S rRNA (cytidine(1402)-2'-O)-methyltransferase [Oscillospiraceae bacterium]|nr:16S rRNA (cytidine(1402)-2'-O)-methyltransferase [Oscillospiraceae bacterium]
MSGTLCLVGTPIGNLGDFSPRGVEALKDCDFIAAEDTRVTLKLLSRYEIKKPMVSYHEHNKAESGRRILERLLAGETCCLVTDAGMPAISDPGEDLVRLCYENDVAVTAVPGPSAVITALALSGRDTTRFVFEGFLPVQPGVRRRRLEEIAAEKRTVIVYEAPHKLQRTLADLCEALGGDRSLTICRELTKLHEEAVPTTLSQAVEKYSQTEPKGEFVLVIAGAPERPQAQLTLEEAARQVLSLKAEGESLKAAAKAVAARTGYGKSALYSAALDMEE